MFIKTEIETESYPQKPQKSSQSSLIYFPNRQQELTPEQTYRNTAIALVQQHKWDEAITQYQQAIQVNPKFAEAYWEMGNLLVQLQQWEQAISCYRKVIQLHPNTAQVYHQLGDVLLKLQQWEAAVEAYQ